MGSFYLSLYDRRADILRIKNASQVENKSAKRTHLEYWFDTGT